MKKSQKGFTIIEVALVLAIAALIFLTVFLAVPALQRNQRNDARKRDVSSVVEAVTAYMSNNPTKNLATEQKKSATEKDPDANAIDPDTGKSTNTPLGKYLDTLSNNTESVLVTNDPGSSEQSIDLSNYPGLYNTAPTSPQGDKITVVIGYRCDSTTKIVKGNKRSAAVVGAAETSQGYDPYCSSAN